MYKNIIIVYSWASYYTYKCLLSFGLFYISVEFKGHQLLEAAKSCDSAKLKKHITPEIINFQHPLTLESSLVRDGQKCYLVACNSHNSNQYILSVSYRIALNWMHTDFHNHCKVCPNQGCQNKPVAGAFHCLLWLMRQLLWMHSLILQALGKWKFENLPCYFSHLSCYSQSFWQPCLTILIFNITFDKKYWQIQVP